MSILIGTMKIVAIVLGSVCTLAAIVIGVCAVVAMVLGDEDDDPEDDLRVHQCEQMAQGLQE
jgi:hypothetical protein